MNNAVMQWKEDFEKSQRLGEGRSRTSSEKSELFELMIWIGGQGAMRDLIRAESLQQAIQFAKIVTPTAGWTFPRRRPRNLSWLVRTPAPAWWKGDANKLLKGNDSSAQAQLHQGRCRDGAG